MKSKVAIAAVVLAVAGAGTAIAASGGSEGAPSGTPGTGYGPGPAHGFFPGGPGFPAGDFQDEFAEDLADELDGVSADEVSDALEAVAEERIDERRAQMAEAIAAQLDGVDADEVQAALEAHAEMIREAVESGERPEPGGFVQTLAEELDLDEEEITDALFSAHEQQMEERGEDAAGPGFGPFGPGRGHGMPGIRGGPGGFPPAPAMP